MTWDGGDESRVQALMAENERLRAAGRNVLAALDGEMDWHILDEARQELREALDA